MKLVRYHHTRYLRTRDPRGRKSAAAGQAAPALLTAPARRRGAASQRAHDKMDGWWVLADSPARPRPWRVARFNTEAEAREYVRALNAASDAPGRPLYFVERWQTSDVLDVERAS